MDIGQRLKKERQRLGMSQAEMAGELGIAKKSQTNYELGHNAPAASYLSAAARIGVDVCFVLTGVPSPQMGGSEAELVRRFRAASPELQAAALAALGAATFMGISNGSGSKPSTGVAIHGGEQGQVFGGDARQENVSIRVGGKKKPQNRKV